jgi:F420-0:gamma-glutamyl ligase-like protein
MEMPFIPNEGKSLTIQTKFGTHARYPVKTHVIMDDDVPEDVLDKYVIEYLQEGDSLFISEKIIAIMQGRAFPVDSIKPSRLAKFLCKFVYKPDYGIGIGSPVTMELAVREVGRVKIIFAAIIAGICKLFGKRGVFYNICGMKARAIDGPCDYTIPPYNTYAKMAPLNPDRVAADLSAYIKEKAGFDCDVVVIDANDIAVNILGKNRKDLPDEFGTLIFDDNPLDQSDQQTPIAIIRPVEIGETNEI